MATKVLIACDSFKDAIDATAACQAIARGLWTAHPDIEIKIFPLSDGGEGLTDILQYHLGLVKHSLLTQDPLRRPISASYHRSLDGQTAYLEMAQTSGLQLLSTTERNPLHTTTIGLGEMIRDAIQSGASRMILGIGGSATHDLGIGMASALGWTFLDMDSCVLPPDILHFAQVAQIIPPQIDLLSGVDITVMCDVTNPLCGPDGAAYTYARQKGADNDGIIFLERASMHMIELLGHNSYLAELPGAGAAGGLGLGACYFLGGTLRSGISTILEMTDFQTHATWADYIITGEGRLDHQTTQGKLISGIIQSAGDTPVIALCGSLQLSPTQVQAMGLYAAYGITPRGYDLSEALRDTEKNLMLTATQLASTML
jgi:glycerate 2-kinase